MSKVAERVAFYSVARMALAVYPGWEITSASLLVVAIIVVVTLVVSMFEPS